MLEIEQTCISELVSGRCLSGDQMALLVTSMMEGTVSEIGCSAILTALRLRGESVEELATALQVMRSFMRPVVVKDPASLLDIVGTGGDGCSSFNVSTAAMVVAAACGARVAKHGNRKVSSSSGSADVLEALGVCLECTPEQVAASIEQAGLGFMFAPCHHPAMRHVASVRKALGFRTFFNLLGPLLNPACAGCLLLGVFSADWVAKMACLLQRSGVQRAMVVSAWDGMDEISISGETHCAFLKEGEIKYFDLTPESFGITRLTDCMALRVTDIEQSKAVLLDVFKDQGGPAQDMVILNAAAALWVAGVVGSISEGVDLAKERIAQGQALKKLEQFIQLSGRASQEVAV